MKSFIEKCILSDEQRSLIVKGIQEGKREYKSILELMPEFTTTTYVPRLQYDSVNTSVEKAIKDNPHTQMKVFKKKAGFHPYIIIQDTIRNIFILVSKLPKNKYIYNASGYRGDFASSNLDRLFEMGAPESELHGDTLYQPSFLLGIDNQPFGIIISYDRDSDVIYEGALRPGQEDWIYKDDITESIILNTNDILHLNNYRASEIEPQLKTTKSDDDIVIRLKNNPLS